MAVHRKQGNAPNFRRMFVKAGQRQQSGRLHHHQHHRACRRGGTAPLSARNSHQAVPDLARSHSRLSGPQLRSPQHRRHYFRGRLPKLRSGDPASHVPPPVWGTGQPGLQYLQRDRADVSTRGREPVFVPRRVQFPGRCRAKYQEVRRVWDCAFCSQGAVWDTYYFSRMLVSVTIKLIFI